MTNPETPVDSPATEEAGGSRTVVFGNLTFEAPPVDDNLLVGLSIKARIASKRPEGESMETIADLYRNVLASIAPGDSELQSAILDEIIEGRVEWQHGIEALLGGLPTNREQRRQTVRKGSKKGGGRHGSNPGNNSRGG
jgi:hypothetical protein